MKAHLCWLNGTVGIEIPVADISDVSQVLLNMVEAAESDDKGVCRIPLPESRSGIIAFTKLVMARSWTEVLYDDLVTMDVVSEALPVVQKYCHADHLLHACRARIQRSRSTDGVLPTTKAVIAYEQQVVDFVKSVKWCDTVNLAIIKSVFPAPFVGYPAEDEEDSDDKVSDESGNEKCYKCFPTDNDTYYHSPNQQHQCNQCGEFLYTQHEYDHCHDNCFLGEYLWHDDERMYNPLLLVQLSSSLLEKAARALNIMITKRRDENHKEWKRSKRARTE